MCRNIKKRILMHGNHEQRPSSIEVTMTAQILIVDDSAVVRRELRNVLDLTGAVLVVGEAADGREAVRQAKVLKPDVVLMDLEIPVLDGFEATRQIKALHLARAVIILTVYASAANQKRAMEAGADAFIVKGTDLRKLLDLFNQYSQRQFDLPNTSGDM
jgi:DNA-binding NarL/FixJ family response regulator